MQTINRTKNEHISRTDSLTHSLDDKMLQTRNTPSKLTSDITFDHSPDKPPPEKQVVLLALFLSQLLLLLLLLLLLAGSSVVLTRWLFLLSCCRHFRPLS